ALVEERLQPLTDRRTDGIGCGDARDVEPRRARLGQHQLLETLGHRPRLARQWAAGSRLPAMGGVACLPASWPAMRTGHNQQTIPRRRLRWSSGPRTAR